MQFAAPVDLRTDALPSSSSAAAVLGVTYGPLGEVCVTTAASVTLFEPSAIADSGSSGSSSNNGTVRAIHYSPPVNRSVVLPSLGVVGWHPHESSDQQHSAGSPAATAAGAAVRA